MERKLPMKKYTEIKDSQRVCVPIICTYKDGYSIYISNVLIEVGFSISLTKEGVVFVHKLDNLLRVLLVRNPNLDWHHLIGYKHSKWTLTYEGDVEYHIFVNDVLKTIRRAYDHWHGL